jgi:hypothetical protein
MMNIVQAIGRFLATFSYPREPSLISYDDLIKVLNRRRSRLDLPRVAERRAPEKPFRPQPYVVVSAESMASSTDTYDYEPSDECGREEPPRGYRP